MIGSPWIFPSSLSSAPHPGAMWTIPSPSVSPTSEPGDHAVFDSRGHRQVHRRGRHRSSEHGLALEIVLENLPILLEDGRGHALAHVVDLPLVTDLHVVEVQISTAAATFEVKVQGVVVQTRSDSAGDVPGSGGTPRCPRRLRRHSPSSCWEREVPQRVHQGMALCLSYNQPRSAPRKCQMYSMFVSDMV